MPDDGGDYALMLATSGQDGAQITFSDARPIPPAEMRKLTTAFMALRQFDEHHGVWDTLEANFVALTRYFDDVMVPSTSDKPFRKARLLADANRHVLNLCASARMFLDYTRHRLKEDGRTSGLEAFTQAASAAYDASPNYRLMEEIRNFAQHRGLPVAGGFMHEKVVEGRSSAEGELHFVRDQLLSDAKLKGVVRRDLEAGAAVISVLPAARDYFERLRGLEAIVLRDDVQVVKSDYKRAWALFDDVQSSPTRSPVIATFVREGAQLKMSQIDLPREAMERVSRAIAGDQWVAGSMVHLLDGTQAEGRRAA